jgi:formate dehydrogenase major subunit
MIQISIDGTEYEATAGEHLIDAINRARVPLSQVCYHPQLGPIQTCDTCIVEVNGELVRACASVVRHGMKVTTTGEEAHAARTEAFDRILRNHQLYCTVCDNNNGNCTVHNTTKLLGVEHQRYPFQTKP